MGARLVIADDHSMVRKSLLMFFEADPEIEIVGEARDGFEALALASSLRPDVVLMDLLMPGMSGLQATTAIRAQVPGVEIVAMTSVMEDAAMPEAIKAGAISYVIKDTRPGELRSAILAAAEGRVALAGKTADRLMDEVPTPELDLAALSREQIALLEHIAYGRSNGEITRLAGMGDGEVHPSVEALLRALGVASRAQAILYAVRQGLVAVADVPALSAASAGRPVG